MNVTSNFDTLIKLVILGDSNVGKSNFLFKFMEGKFSPIHVATVGFDFKSKICTLPDSKKVVKLQVWDTAGQEKYLSVNKNLLQRVQGVIFMYDITQRSSFERLSIWYEGMKKILNEEETPLLLVGNKLDDQNDNRIVEKSEGEAWARDKKMDFLEASGKDGTNVDKVFYTIAEKVLKNVLNLNKGEERESFDYILGRDTKPPEKSGCKC